MLAAKDNLNQSPNLIGNGRKVIVIDDDELTCVLVRGFLEECGFRAITAVRGADGLALFEEHGDVSLVITDMAMPGMDGADVISALQRLNPKLKIIAMSGFMPESNRVPKDVLFLSKPFEKRSFTQAVEAALA